jgi:hypothetical protein
MMPTSEGVVDANEFLGGTFETGRLNGFVDRVKPPSNGK